jgi:hypothetical protein
MNSRFNSYRAVNTPRLRYNKNANGVICDVVHILYQGVLYLQNVIQSLCTGGNVTSFTRTHARARTHAHTHTHPFRFSQNPQTLNSSMCTLFNRISPKLGNKAASKDTNHLRPYLKYGFHHAGSHTTHGHSTNF